MRGDDELLELLGIMGGDYGGQGSGAAIDGGHTKSPQRAAAPTASTAGSESESACVPETGWNRSIWNPHVFDEAAAGVGVGGTGAAAMKLVSPQEEVLRQQAVAVVFARFQVLGKELGIRSKNEMFERWQFSRKLKEGRGGDPILPAESFFDPGLDAELRELGVNKSRSRNLCCELGRASKSALKTLRKQLRGVVNTPAAGAGRPSSKRRVAVKRLDGSTYVLQLGKNKLRMNSAHYDKMKELFRRACVQGSSNSNSNSLSSWSSAAGTSFGGRGALPWAGDFHDSLFACLMRYEALQGGGFQASMGGDAFDVLLRRLGVKMECFASPFNCRYSRYCSAFKDTDKPFGSVGSFFDFQPTEGAYEANPPFVRDVILKMANHMDTLLQATSKPLTFVVIIPCWEDSVGWKRLRDSAFLSKHVKLDQKDHGYCEGKQHLRRNRYRLASFHTSIFFLQTEAARRGRGGAGGLEQACQELEQAFAVRQEADGSGGGGGGGHGGASGGGSGERAEGGSAGDGDKIGPSSSGLEEVGVDGDSDSDGKLGRRRQQELLLQEGAKKGEEEEEEEEEAGLPSSSSEINGGNDGETMRSEGEFSETEAVVVCGKRPGETSRGDGTAVNAGLAAAVKTKKKKREREKEKHPQRSGDGDGDGETSASSTAGRGEEPGNGFVRLTSAESAERGVPSPAEGPDSASMAGAEGQRSAKKKKKKRRVRAAAVVAAKDGAGDAKRTAGGKGNRIEAAGEIQAKGREKDGQAHKIVSEEAAATGADPASARTKQKKSNNKRRKNK